MGDTRWNLTQSYRSILKKGEYELLKSKIQHIHFLFHGKYGWFFIYHNPL